MERRDRTPKILAVGSLGYHDRNIVAPITKELLALGATIIHEGGQLEWFVERNFAYQVEDWVSGVPPSLEPYDTVLFWDYWTPVMPMFEYRAWTGGHRPRYVGLFHGSVQLTGDVALNMPNARRYEQYLRQCFTSLIVPSHQHMQPGDVVIPFPIEEQIKRVRPNLKPANRVIYAQRWDADKRPDRFVKFAGLAAQRGIECIATTDDFPDDWNVRCVGWQDQEGLEALAKDGGYVWGAADQETFGYAIIDMISYGLTPLLRKSDQYLALGLSNRFFWNDYEEAILKIEAKMTLTEADWQEFIARHRGNARKIAEVIA